VEETVRGGFLEDFLEYTLLPCEIEIYRVHRTGIEIAEQRVRKGDHGFCGRTITDILAVVARQERWVRRIDLGGIASGPA
jgi:hypothetical protein